MTATTAAGTLGREQADAAPTQPREGEPFVVPAGAPVHSMGTGRWHTSKRALTVCPFSVREPEPGWTVVTWPGLGGYWRRIVVHDGELVDRFPFEGKPCWEKIDREPAR